MVVLRRLQIVALLVIVTVAPSSSQVPGASAPAAPAGENAFTHITIEHGLSDQRVQAVAQDRAGFLWFGTNNGLNRFDGYRVVAYRNDPADRNSIAGNHIDDVYEDRSGMLWVGTWSGLSAFDRRTERFTNYRHDPANPRSLSSNVVAEIYEDRSGVLWLGTSGGGLNSFDRATGMFTRYLHDPADPHSLSNDSVRAIAEDRSGTLWVGTLDGLNRLDRATGRFTTYRHNPADPRSLSHDSVWDILEDRTGALWVGTDGGGLSRFDQASVVFTHYRHDLNDPNTLGSDRVDCLFEDETGALWVGTFGGGVSVLDVARRRFHTYRHNPTFPTSLGHDYVAEIVADRSGLIWLGTHGNGVDLHDPGQQAFTIHRHDPRREASLSSNNVWVVTEDPDGALWIGTQDRGLDRFDRRSGHVVHYPPDPTNRQGLGHPWVSALAHDGRRTLWVGTYGGGLYRLDTSSGTFTAFRHDPANRRSLSHDTIAALHIDRTGALWVGTRGGGLNRFDPESGGFTALRHDPSNPDTIGHDWIWAIAEDRRGNLWLGTSSGLTRLELGSGTITRYRHNPRDPDSLTDDGIWSLHVDRAGDLWIGTVGGGLDRFNHDSVVFTHYRERDGLASDRVTSIVEDGRASDATPGNLWITTARGVSKLERDRKTFRTYGAAHGLPLTEYNMGGSTARNGEVLLASIAGLITFFPAVVRDQRDMPPVVFTNFLLANTPVRIGGENSPLQQTIDRTSSIALSYADRVISFEFAALNYRAPKQTRYRYKLDGFDNDWITVDSTQRLVTYTNLAPGNYVFRVMASSAAGKWNQGRAIALTITPPWWATWWFRGLALALFVGCATGFYAWRVRNLKRHRHALEGEIADRTRVEDALRASHARIQDLAGRLISAQEAERARVARELHDDVTQQLAAMSISLAMFKRRLPPDLADATPDLTILQEQALAMAEALRHVSHELHPGLLQHTGLPAALQATCADFCKLHGIDIVCNAEPGLAKTHPDVALCLYRITQEALHNAVRHAMPRRVEVVLTSLDGFLELRIEDDGRGFDLTEARARGGLGLTSIEERVRLLPGQVEIASTPGQGTAIRVRVPREISEQQPAVRQSAQTESVAG